MSLDLRVLAPDRVVRRMEFVLVKAPENNQHSQLPVQHVDTPRAGAKHDKRKGNKMKFLYQGQPYLRTQVTKWKATFQNSQSHTLATPPKPRDGLIVILHLPAIVLILDYISIVITPSLPKPSISTVSAEC